MIHFLLGRNLLLNSRRLAHWLEVTCHPLQSHTCAAHSKLLQNLSWLKSHYKSFDSTSRGRISGNSMWRCTHCFWETVPLRKTTNKAPSMNTRRSLQMQKAFRLSIYMLNFFPFWLVYGEKLNYLCNRLTFSIHFLLLFKWYFDILILFYAVYMKYFNYVWAVKPIITGILVSNVQK